MTILFPEIKEHLQGIFPEAMDGADNFSGQIAANPTASDAVTLYFARHSNTGMDDKNQSHGWIDEALSDNGINQSRGVADKFKGVKLNRLYSSDLVRARQSAYAIAHVTGAHPEPTPELRPLNTGKFAGMNHDEVHEAIKPYFDKWKIDPDAKIPDGESFKSFRDRNVGFLNKVLLDAKPGDKIGIVAHSMTKRLYEALAHGKEVEGREAKQILTEPHGMVETFIYSPNGGFKLK